MKESLSIITITYKDPGGLRETCESLKPLIGTDLDWEHVIVDSSPDLSGSVIQNLRELGWPLRHISAPAKGIYTAMNEGINHSTKEVLWFLNGKDRLSSMRELFDALREKSFAQARVFVGAVDRVMGEQTHFRWYPGKSFGESLLGACGPCHQGMLLDRTVFSEVGLYDSKFKMSADYHHHLRMLYSLPPQRDGGSPFLLSRTRIALFDVTGVGSSGYRREFAELKQIHQELRPLMRSARGESEYLRHLTYRWLHICRVTAFKLLRRVPFYEGLRSFWHRWKRFS